MTGTSDKEAGDYPVAFSSVDGSTQEADCCKECGRTHVYDFAKPSDMLHHDKCSVKMCRPTHVRLTNIYEVSMRMLRLERSCHTVSDLTIDSASHCLVLERPEEARGRLAASSYAVRNWPLPPIVDFSQPDPPYPGSDFKPDAGTYSGLWDEQDTNQNVSEMSPGDLNLISDKITDIHTQASVDTAVAPTDLPSAGSQASMTPSQVTARSPQPAAASPAAVASGLFSSSSVKSMSTKPIASMPDKSEAGGFRASPSKSIVDSRTPASTARASITAGKPSSGSEAAQTKPDSSDGLFPNIGRSNSHLVLLNAGKKAKPPSSTPLATIDAQKPPCPALKVPTIKLELNPAGASNTQKVLAGNSLTKTANSISLTKATKSQVQSKQPAASASITKVPAVKPTHPFKPGHIVWVARREYEGENYNPLEHLRDITNRPACVLAAKVPGQPEHVYICGVSLCLLLDLCSMTLTSSMKITTFADYRLGSVPLSELKKGNYLAIATSNNPNPVCVHKVKMVGGKSMPRDRRVSYINANRRYIVPAKMLDKLRESRVLGDHQIDEEGVMKLREVRAMAVAAAGRL